MGECANCIYWCNAQWVMNKYGEGCGICRLDGQIRFCSHKCPFCVKSEDDGEYT